MALGFSTSGARAASRPETLEAIHCVENPHDVPYPGRFGELGPYQFRRNTWRMHTDLPFERALDRQASDQVAIRHYEWIARGLRRAGFAVTPYNVALAWNGGLAATVRGRVSRSARSYAERVSNLATEFHAAQLAGIH